MRVLRVGDRGGGRQWYAVPKQFDVGCLSRIGDVLPGDLVIEMFYYEIDYIILVCGVSKHGLGIMRASKGLDAWSEMER